MSASYIASNVRTGWRAAVAANPLVRIVVGTLLVWFPVPLITKLAHRLVAKPYSQIWPEILATAVSFLAYRFFVTRMEKRPLNEFAAGGAGRELGFGFLLGGGLHVLLIVTLAVFGVYQFDSINPLPIGLVSLLPLYVGVAMLEEMVGRGIIFGISEEALGSVPALAISALFFGGIHMLNSGATILGGVSCTLFGLMFAAAYMATRRLWICVGIHIAWNYFEGQVFSGVVSGYKDGTGLIRGHLVGSEMWTGGSFGIEGSVAALAIAGLAALVLLYTAYARRRFVGKAAQALLAG